MTHGTIHHEPAGMSLWRQVSRHLVRRRWWFLGAVVALLALMMVLAFVQRHRAESAADRFQADLTAFVGRVNAAEVDTSGIKARVVPAEFTDLLVAAPRLDRVRWGTSLSHDYDLALGKDGAMGAWSEIAERIGAQAEYVDEHPDAFDRGGDTFLTTYFDQLDEFIDTADGLGGTERVDTESPLTILKMKITAGYDDLAKAYATAEKGFRDIEVPDAFVPEAQFAIASFAERADLLDGVRGDVDKATSYGEISELIDGYRIEDLRASYAILDSFYQLSFGPFYPAVSAASVKLSIGRDLNRMTATSAAEGRRQAVVSYYVKYAQQSLLFERLGGVNKNYVSGHLTYALSEIKTALKDVPGVSERHRPTRDAIDWASRSDVMVNNSASARRRVLDGFLDYANYTAQKTDVFDPQVRVGVDLRPDLAQRWVKRELGRLPSSPELESEQAALDQATLAGTGAGVDLVKAVAPINAEYKQLTIAYDQLTSQASLDDADRARARELSGRLPKLDAQITAAAEKLQSRTNELAKELSNATIAFESAVKLSPAAFDTRVRDQFDQYFDDLLAR